MRISSRTEYAFRALVDLAMHRTEGVVPVGDIARRQAIPRKFLEQILLVLKGAGFVASQRGPGGGYYLAMPPSQITFNAVVELTERDLIAKATRKSESAQAAGNPYAYAFRAMWQDISARVREALEAFTIRDLCVRVAELSGVASPEYVI